MNMSPSCTAPIHAEIIDADREHPKFSRYMTYRTAMARQLVFCQSFAAWVAQDDQDESGHEIVFQVTATDAALSPGWYKNTFAPVTRRMKTFGPFDSRSKAEGAAA